MENKNYVIGVDGGGTKTEVALADLEGKILKLARTGPSSPRNVGIGKGAENIAQAIKKVKMGRKVDLIFVGLAAIEEEYKFEKEKIKREILKKLRDFKGKLIIDSDQIVAFRSGTKEKNGIVLISGTGCVCHGWRRLKPTQGRGVSLRESALRPDHPPASRAPKEAKVSGWGWLNDEGSGFWAGQKGFQAILKELDGRGPKTLITKLIFKEWKSKNKENLLKKIYSRDSIRQISLMSGSIDRAAEKGDKIAKNIMAEAGKELALAVKTVIKKLNFEKEKFPLVLVGRMFKSKIVLETAKMEIKKLAPKIQFIQPKENPVVGAVKLAIENLK